MFTFRIDDELELRPLDFRHASTLFEVIEANRSYLRKWLPWLDENREEQDIRQFIAWTRRRFAENKDLVAGIWHHGVLVGVVSLHQIKSPGGSAFMGYWISEESQGQGLVTRAARALLDHAFRDLELHRVEIRCAPANTASHGIPSRLGFRKEGTLKEAERLYDRYEDSVVYGMLRADWLEADDSVY
jgi:ribosomal-protein-serine acetyltransferase